MHISADDICRPWRHLRLTILFPIKIPLECCEIGSFYQNCGVVHHQIRKWFKSTDLWQAFGFFFDTCYGSHEFLKICKLPSTFHKTNKIRRGAQGLDLLTSSKIWYLGYLKLKILTESVTYFGYNVDFSPLGAIEKVLWH